VSHGVPAFRSTSKCPVDRCRFPSTHRNPLESHDSTHIAGARLANDLVRGLARRALGNSLELIACITQHGEGVGDDIVLQPDALIWHHSIRAAKLTAVVW
jgi:hypothetical protein